MKKYTTVIFDLDGTLMYTLQDIADAVNECRGKYNLPPLPLDTIKMNVGYGSRILVEKSIMGECKENFESVYQAYLPIYHSKMSHTAKPYEGMTETLKYLKKHGYKLGVFSNKPHYQTIEVIDKYFTGIFDYVVGQKDDYPPKPCPDSMKDLLKCEMINDDEVMYCGDSETDMETANRGGWDKTACGWGYREKELLESYNPTYLIFSPLELKNIL